MNAKSNLKFRLIVMNFLEFAVWGAYLTSLGRYLGNIGLGSHIKWFFAMQGIVSIFMPTLMGILADRRIQAQKVLSLCHGLAGIFMLGAGYYCLSAGDAVQFGPLFVLYSISLAFFMPTIALVNSVAYNALREQNMDPVKEFPPIRVFGTIGFIVTMWFVNCAVMDNDGFGFTLGENDFKFQYTYMQFLVSGLMSVVLFLYCFTLPACKLVKKESKSLAEQFGLSAFKLFKTKKMALFFVFSALLGMSLQVTNGFATPYLTHFKSIPEMADTFGANNATMLVSLSQIAEALCILLIPYFLKRYGIKIVMLIAMSAWVLRFGFFGIGNPAFPGVILIVLSCIVYGVAFDFFNVSGGIFVDKECEPDVKASAQGLFMLMTNGLGATIGTLAAGLVINNLCHWNEQGFLVGNTPTSWSMAWYIFAGFALVVAVAFWILFDYKHVREK